MCAKCKNKCKPAQIFYKDAYVFDDGTTVSLWKLDGFSRTMSYRLSDGQELLNVDYPASPDRVTVEGLEDGFEDMEESAQKTILDYYEKRETPFDIHHLLEDAYTDWNLCQKEEKRFNPHIAAEDISPSIATERYIGFLSTVTVSIPSSVRFNTCDKTSSVVLFDRSTGTVLPPAELFSVPEEEAIEVLAKLSIKELWNMDIEQIKPLIKLDEIIWFQEYLHIHFPADSLAIPPKDDSDLSEEETETIDTYIVEIDYDSLKKILHPWAIPE